jgi:hypothetical protein
VLADPYYREGRLQPFDGMYWSVRGAVVPVGSGRIVGAPPENVDTSTNPGPVRRQLNTSDALYGFRSTCWCEATTVHVTPQMVREGRTHACSRPRCLLMDLADYVGRGGVIQPYGE